MISEQAAQVLAAQVLEAQWREPGFTCPNSRTYPWLWLWDSCFHAIVWAQLERPDRAIAELSTVLAAQDSDGFVPHVQYLNGSTAHDEFWGRRHTSSITQPPMYGHAIAELARQGVAIPADLLERATVGLNFLFERRRRTASGLIEIVHPWESGCDHSPRWDDLVFGGDEFDEQTLFRRKGELLQGVERLPGGAPIWNSEFAVGSVAFSALTAFCAAELAQVTGDKALLSHAAQVSAALSSRWEPELRTWVDDGPTATGSGRVRTVEALLPLLTLPLTLPLLALPLQAQPETFDGGALTAQVASLVERELCDEHAFAGEFGERQVHREEPTYLPTTYWRGPSWPQLNYLLWVGLKRVGKFSAAAQIAQRSYRGAVQSGWAEYFDADTGSACGAVPQSWTTLAVCMNPQGEMNYK
ncbi:MAG: hypothetical protein WD029_09125 [Microthrixaceae bacterium]